MCSYVCMYGCLRTTFWTGSLFSTMWVPGDQIQTIRLSSKYFYSLSQISIIFDTGIFFFKFVALEPLGMEDICWFVNFSSPLMFSTHAWHIVGPQVMFIVKAVWLSKAWENKVEIPMVDSLPCHHPPRGHVWAELITCISLFSKERTCLVFVVVVCLFLWWAHLHI